MAPSSCSNSPWAQCSVNIILQDQIEDEPIQLTTQIPALRNQAILATPAISAITTSYSSVFSGYEQSNVEFAEFLS